MSGVKEKGYVPRKVFTSAEKVEIGRKSNFRCSHCGKENDGDLTVEHVIPLSKGGTNDISNLVSLCKKCNAEKDDLICHPAFYYKYLLEPYMQELLDNHNKYYKTERWLTKQSILPDDKKRIEVETVMPINISRRKKGNKCAGSFPKVKIAYLLEKAIYSDLDDIYNFLLRYNKKYLNNSSSPEEVKDSIADCFENGCLYFVRNKVGEIMFILPVRVLTYTDGVYHDITCFHFDNIIAMKDEVNFFILAKDALSNILNEITELNLSSSGTVVFTIAGGLNSLVSNTVVGSMYESLSVKSYVSSDKLFSLEVCIVKRGWDEKRQDFYFKRCEELSLVDVMDFSSKLRYRLYGTAKIPVEDTDNWNPFADIEFKDFDEVELPDELVPETRFFTKEELNSFEKQEDGSRPIFSVPMSELLETKKCRGNKASSSLVKQRIKLSSEYVPVGVNRKLQVVKNFDVYWTLKELGYKNVNCQLFD